ncbi:MAG: hypothetical protein ACRDTE_19590 [Pseudonocardiaceae bacterium]
MADTRGVVIITVALIGAAATILAALIGRSDGGPTPPSIPPPSTTSPFPPSEVATSQIQPGPAPPEPAQPEPTAPEPTVSPPPAAFGDLGLSRPITRPACDGRFVVFVGAAVDPTAYRTEVQDLLDAHPGSEYLLAGDTCPSLRSRDDAGNEIYGVYYGPFANRDQACGARGGGSYVKVLDTVTDSGVIIGC